MILPKSTCLKFPQRSSAFFQMKSAREVFEEVFMSTRTPYRVYGGLRFYDRADVVTTTLVRWPRLTPAVAALLARMPLLYRDGDALSVLVITRLPFDVPDDPIVAARSETFERAFDEYSVPEAVLKFRQGFGRLIRTKTDRGVVVVLDRRIISKAYGRTFLESLPHCTIRRAPLAQLPKDAAQWLGG